MSCASNKRYLSGLSVNTLLQTQAEQTQVRGILHVHRQLLLGAQVVVGKHVEVSLQRLRRMRLAG